MKELVAELLAYVNQDLVGRQIQKLPLSPFSRRRLFRKTSAWPHVFPHSPVHTLHSETGDDELNESIRNAQNWLLGRQRPDGEWCAPLRADTTLESDMITFYFFMGWQEKYADKIQRFAAYILKQQNADGGWPIFRNGPSEISATVKGYWALKFAGYPVSDGRLARAAGCIQRLGGIHKVNTYSKFYMALFGLYDWGGVPAIPPELMLFPKWFYFNIYEMACWTRGIVIPLSIIWAKRPTIPCPPHARLDELFPVGMPRWVPLGFDDPLAKKFFSWRRFFLEMDHLIKSVEGNGPYFLRSFALGLAEKWMVKRFAGSGGFHAIFPAMVNAVMALRVLGYPDEHPHIRMNVRELEKFELDRGEDGLEMQPCVSPVWDTAIAALALGESGLRADHPSLVRSARWLLSREIRTGGDWQVKNPSGPIAGWAFEYANPFYPDIDDTAMVLLALRRVHLEGDAAVRREQAFLRSVNWILSMQSVNGGWGAFDMNNNKYIFNQIPFADHNAMIDPPTTDITARIMELLGQIGYDQEYPRVRRAIDFMRMEQEEDGSWYGRWGVNYIYGTWQAIRGLTAGGVDVGDPAIQRGLYWLRTIQNSDGGWGETCQTYHDPAAKGRGPSTPSQTAWALMAFLSCGMVGDPALEAGIEYLIDTQKPDGTWDETEFTGTGFPKVFYLEYTLYRHSFPLLALGMFRKYRRLARLQRHHAQRAQQLLGV